VKSTRAILSVQYTPASATAGKAVGGFLRYVHYRDHLQRGDESRGVSGLVRYVAYRDQASPDGRLFTRDGTAGDHDRRELVGFVRRSLESTSHDQVGTGRIRAVYRFVLSPEDARGLDLRQLAREIMGQLERDVSGVPPWIAAEHRNTAHPHVHIVMAARREVSPGQFRGVQVTRQRLARMKAVMGREIERQRGNREPQRPLEARLLEGSRYPAGDRNRDLASHLHLEPVHARLARHDPFRWRQPHVRHMQQVGLNWHPIRSLFARLAAHYHHEMEREEREQMRRWRFSGRDRGEEREREVYE
jgi:hypothetical protein